MRNIFYIVIAIALIACAKQTREEQTEQQQITLQATLAGEADGLVRSTESKATATAFESGDELGLFVVKQGMDVQSTNNLVNNARMLVANDGTIKGDPTAVYYPSKTSLNLYSYYPYQSGDATADALGVQVGIRTDQTDFSAIKRSDLCFGFLDNVEPSNSAKQITFKHSFAQVRINITTYVGCEAVKQVRLINIKDSALLNIQTGAITLKPHLAEVTTNKSAEKAFLAIIPAQTFSGACIAIDLNNPTDPTDLNKGRTFIFNATTPINLKQSATNTLNLNINDKHIVTLNGTPTISNWNTSNSTGTISSAVNNQISLYWLAPHADYAAADKVTLTITDPLNVTKDIDLIPTVDAKSSSQYAVYNLNLALDNTTYPLKISRIRVYKSINILRDLSEVTLVGKVLYKSGSHVLATDFNREAIKVNGLLWATGNLVANGPNSCVIGAPGDGGLYFQYGSLIGYKGGANGDGTGVVDAAKHPNGVWWNGATAYSAADVAVKPATYTNQATWPYFENAASGGFGYYYFNGFAEKYKDFQSQSNANNPTLGIGDPCAYYLGSPWRLPTYVELSAITGSAVEGAWVPWATAGVTGRWEKTGPKSAIGAWFGPNSRTGTPTEKTDLFIPASGLRNNSNGTFTWVGIHGFLWSSSVYDIWSGFSLRIHESAGVIPRSASSRATGFPVRCVQDAPTEPQPPTADQIVTINGLKWTKGNLVATGGHNAKVGDPGDGGLYFQYGGLIGYKGGANGDGTGIVNAAKHPNGVWWNGATAYSASEVVVKPATYTNQATWPYFDNVASGGFGYYYFNGFAEKFMDFQSQPNANNPALGIGDPCAYYLGSDWRLPKYDELSAITGSAVEAAWVPWATAGVTGRWEKTGPKSAIGAWFGPNSRTGTPTEKTDLFIPASGYRRYNTGVFWQVGIEGFLWSSSVYNASYGFCLIFNESAGVIPRRAPYRAYGFPVRCVSN